MADKEGEHSKDAPPSKTDDGKVPDTGATLSKQDTENIIDGLMKRLAGSKDALPTDPSKSGN